MLNRAGIAFRCARRAICTSVIYETVAKIRPILWRQQLLKVKFYLIRVFLVRQTHSVRKPSCVRIDHHAGDSEKVAENKVCGFPPDPRQLSKVIHIIRNFAAEIVNQHPTTSDYVLCLIPEKAR